MAQYSSILPQLQEHIGVLSSAIEAQEEILRDLRHRRTDAYQDLNFLVDPMARLPLELQSDIFLRCFPDSSTSATEPIPSAPPMVFMAVSRMWRDIALATPRLWAALRMKYLPRSDSFVERCRNWMKRAGRYPLTLALHGDLIVDHHARDLLDEFSEQLHHLCFQVTCKNPQLLLSSNVQFPCLETLTIHRGDRASSDTLDCIQLIGAAPNLLECDLRNMFFNDSDNSDDETDGTHYMHSMVHSSLQQLRLGCPWPWDDNSCQSESSAVPLQHLTLPALRGLYMTKFDIKMEHFISFLIRSSPPLDTVFINFPSPDEQIVSDCFRHIPSLMSLTLDGDSSFPVISILAAHTTLLPNLGHLTIQPWRRSAYWDFDAVKRLLSARPLRSFRIRHEDSGLSDETVIALIKELEDSRGGVDICVVLVE
ncbi:hypothetical protein R3P38DRAFT_2872240 [Favolaschia claudopus]|uniref:F-box domain-containing protein n=1 Tax=Favolaschia claudopus TaxID=2862362 RepID=A0AAW0D9W2_9AGAR